MYRKSRHHRERSRSGESRRRRRSFSRSRSPSRPRQSYFSYYGNRVDDDGGWSAEWGGSSSGGRYWSDWSRSRSRERSHSRSPMSSRRRYASVPGPNTCLGIFGLNQMTTERDLVEVFSLYGRILDCSVVLDAHTRRSRGFAFITYERMKDAKLAKDSCAGIEIHNRLIRADFSTTQRAHTPTPGVYVGKKPVDEQPRRRPDEYRDYTRSPSPYYRCHRYYRRSRS